MKLVHGNPVTQTLVRVLYPLCWGDEEKDSSFIGHLYNFTMLNQLSWPEIANIVWSN
jgi:hypothetical protein